MTLFNSLACHQTNGASSTLPKLILDAQAKAASGLAEQTLPTRKTESWKYSAKRIGDISALPALTAYTSSKQETALPWQSTDSEGYLTLNCIDGSWSIEDNAVKGLTIKTFSALSDSEASKVLAAFDANSADLPFEIANNAGFSDGLFISSKAGAVIDTKVLLNIAQTSSGVSFPRVFIELGANSQLTCIERHSSALADSEGLSNTVVHIEQADNSRLHYIRMDMEQSEQCKSVALTRAKLQRSAYLESHCLGLGSAMGRHDFHVQMLQEGSECQLNGVCVTTEKQHYDNHTCIEHIAPHCQSNENYRCIADDQSQIVFNGRIHIHPDAQKTLGAMSNKNLILSSQAEIDTKPELEIYADDVKCAHGTTIGQLEEEEVYYLKTRGLTDQQARQMLTLGFILEVVRANPIESIADYWENELSQLLSFDSDNSGSAS